MISYQVGSQMISYQVAFQNHILNFSKKKKKMILKGWLMEWSWGGHHTSLDEEILNLLYNFQVTKKSVLTDNWLYPN